MPTERPHDAPLGMPSPEALQMATDAIRRRYVLPETMQHPEVRSECLRLAYLIQSYGLTTAKAEPRHVEPDKRRCMLSRPGKDHRPCAAWSELTGRANWLKPCKQGNYPPAI